MNERVPVEDRFMDKIVVAEGHWLWIGAHKPTGYGMFWFRGDECFIAHRASYIMFKGEIPSHLVVDHACKVKSCVNPRHLRLVKQLDNCTVLARPSPFTINKAKTHCKRGHPFSEENTALYKRPDGCTTRVCLTCWPGMWRHAIIKRGPPPGIRPRKPW